MKKNPLEGGDDKGAFFMEEIGIAMRLRNPNFSRALMFVYDQMARIRNTNVGGGWGARGYSELRCRRWFPQI